MSKSIALWMTDSRGIHSIRRYLRMEQAVRLVEQHKAEPVLHNQTGGIIALRLNRQEPKPAVASKSAFVVNQAGVVVERPARASCTAFSKAEVDAIVGLRGKSQTAHLTEDQKAERIRRRWCPEDMVECAQQKIAVYRDVH
jgi:hypothetical protein